jgi:hypothetical protein
MAPAVVATPWRRLSPVSTFGGADTVAQSVPFQCNSCGRDDRPGGAVPVLDERALDDV